MNKNGCRQAAIACALGAISLLTSGCVITTAAGDPGCIAYGEARLAMPRAVALPTGAWGVWIADLDDRMSGTCR